jgi:trimeric autotransporter adhesin
MKKILLALSLSTLGSQAIAQLYSSGNNTIVGNNVGIGLNNPATRLHIMGDASNTEVLRIQNNAVNSTTRFTIFNDGGTSTRSTFTKYGSTFAGGYTGASTQFPFANLFAFGNVKGSLMLNAAGSIGISYYNGVTNKLRYFIDSTTRTSIGGTAWPKAHVHINNTDDVQDTLRITNNTTGHNSTDGLAMGNNGNNAFIWNYENANLTLGTNNTERLRIDNSGLVRIGNVNTAAGYKLFVEQGILTEKVKVAVKTTSEWSDYVFAPTYKLMPLPQLATYVATQHHLPNVPSASEVVTNGIDIAKMDAKLLEKIEELTLYMIELQQQNEVLSKRLKALEAQVK